MCCWFVRNLSSPRIPLIRVVVRVIVGVISTLLARVREQQECIRYSCCFGSPHLHYEINKLGFYYGKSSRVTKIIMDHTTVDKQSNIPYMPIVAKKKQTYFHPKLPHKPNVVKMQHTLFQS